MHMRTGDDVLATVSHNLHYAVQTERTLKLTSPAS